MSRVRADDRLLTVDTVRDIQSLSLFARHIIDGLSIGRHVSHHKGFSTEFKEHRSYVPGDQLRTLDWKLYAKTDRLYIKQFEEEINLMCMIAIDSSASMSFAGSRSNGITKYQYASALAACIAYLLLQQQDAVGLSRLSPHLSENLPPRSRPNYLQDISRVLLSPTQRHDSSLNDDISHLAGRLRGRHLLFIISDFFDEPDALLKTLKLIRGARHDVILLQVWDHDEVEFPFSQMVEFHNLELPTHKQTVNCQQVAQAYRENVRTFREKMTNGCREHGIDYIPCTTSQSVGEVLRTLVNGRSSR